MQQHDIQGFERVGLYGLTYKADVDDVRDAPTLQLLDVFHRRFGDIELKCYDPMLSRDVVRSQYHDLEVFLAAVDFVVIMVDHSELRKNLSQLNRKVVLDTRHICPAGNAYQL